MFAGFAVSPFYFNYNISIERGSVTKDSSGGSVKEWETVPDPIIPANIQPASVREQQIWASRNLIVDHVIYVETNPGFIRGDRIKVEEDERLFTVEGVVDFAGFSRLYKIVVSQLLP